MERALRAAAGRHAYDFVGEPQPRNTAVAVALAALLCRREAPESVLLVVPADHPVAPLAGYRAALRAMAARAASSEALVTLGLVPDHPATGYGWLEVGRRVAGTRALPVQRVTRYVEKPSLAVAKRLLADGKHRWNGGTFAFRPEAFLGEARRLLPEMVSGLEGALALRTRPRREAALARVYRALAPVSVDHGVFEEARHVETVAAAISWDDLGSFDALARHRTPDARGNRVRGEVTLVDAHDCVVEAAHGHVALLGVKDLIVVRTKDTLLVLPRGQGERVREIVARLEAEGRGDLLR
jgi:mannose-1-phosphate guanylyltransferase